MVIRLTSSIKDKKNVSELSVDTPESVDPDDPQPIDTGEYHENIKSHVSHGPNCRYYNCKSCLKSFGSREDAMAGGYRP